MPVFNLHLLDYRGLGIGRRVREHRLRKGYTLADLAQRIGMSQAKLSNIETEKTSLDLAELVQIAQVLEVSLPAFVPRGRLSHYFVKRGAELKTERPIARPLLGPEPGPAMHHNKFWPLAEPFVGKHMEPLAVQIHPLGDDELRFICHDHEEFMFVLRGTVETRLRTNDGLSVQQLRPGDCMYFRSNLPHCHRSLSSEPADTLTVIYSLRGAIDPNDGEPGSAGPRFFRRGIYGDPVREAAEKIALLRRSRGLTLAALARNVGLSARQLAAVESGEKAPDLHLLLHLAREFRRPLEYFFATTVESQPHHFIQRAADIAKVPVSQRKGSAGSSGGDAHVFRRLASGFLDAGMHPYYVQVRSGHADGMITHEHHGQEFIYVLDGELELVTFVENEEVVEPLRAGDSVFLESSVPHLLRSQARNPFSTTSAEVIDVFWSPLGESYLFEPQ